MRHKPGQYLTFALELPGTGPLKRNYSISSAPEDRSYRISVKREAKPGVHGRGAKPHSLRVFRSCRRIAGGLKQAAEKDRICEVNRLFNEKFHVSVTDLYRYRDLTKIFYPTLANLLAWRSKSLAVQRKDRSFQA
jgi:hypothetical protein